MLVQASCALYICHMLKGILTLSSYHIEKARGKSCDMDINPRVVRINIPSRYLTVICGVDFPLATPKTRRGTPNARDFLFDNDWELEELKKLPKKEQQLPLWYVGNVFWRAGFVEWNLCWQFLGHSAFPGKRNRLVFMTIIWRIPLIIASLGNRDICM